MRFDPDAGLCRKGENRVIRRLRAEAAGLAMVLAAGVLLAIGLAPELRICAAPMLDSVLHIAAAERLAEAVGEGEPFLDPWVSEWGLGYPMWRTYQPVPHLVTGAWLWATAAWIDSNTAFALLKLILLVLFPAGVYVGARGLGLSPPAAGLASLLAVTPTGREEFGRFGLGLASYVWSGSGLFTQLFAFVVLPPAIGLTVHALDTGLCRLRAAAALACLALSHIIFGYVGFVSAAVLAAVGPAGMRGKRLVRLATVVAPALLLLAWFVIPVFLVGDEINHSRLEAAYKWDSFGAERILSELVTGRLLDHGRVPVLTALLALGTAVAAVDLRNPVARRLLALTAVWLALYFGRPTWGEWLRLVAVPRDLHLHRLQAAFEWCACLLGGWGVVRIGEALRGSRAGHAGALALALAAAAAVGLLAVDRARYLAANAEWGDRNLALVQKDRADLDAAIEDVREILAERPGRASAGPTTTLGGGFNLGSVPVFAFLARAHIDQATFYYHTMSRTADLMPVRDESRSAHFDLFGIRAVIATRKAKLPPGLLIHGIHGRFAVFEASHDGFFSLVDAGGKCQCDPSLWTEVCTAWMRSPLPEAGIVEVLEGDAPGIASFAPREPFPPVAPAQRTPRGEVLTESRDGEVYAAEVEARRPCHVLVKFTWYPDLTASVDGLPTPMLRVTPGFAAVPVATGRHRIEVRYAPGPLKPILFALGLVAFGACAWLLRRPGARDLEAWAADRLDRLLRRPVPRGAPPEASPAP